MKSYLSGPISWVLVLITVASGCRTVRGAGEDIREAADVVGDAAEAVFTDQGAELVIQSPIQDVDRRARVVVREMGFQLTEAAYEDAAMEREYEARTGERVVHIKLEARGASATKLSVSHRTGTADFDREQAREIIRRVQQQR